LETLLKVKFFAFIRDVTGCKEADLPDSGDVRALAEALSARFGPALREKLFTKGGELHPEIIILVNGRHVSHLGGLDAPLTTGDVVSVFPMVAGG
jgi:molybdopterin synthase sulfur carrier subunit